jgi:phosphopantothenoylcysteine decarboxylase/phosphopantothenate--cysteine ligase
MTDSNAQFENSRILLGISGGIAAYKAADLAAKLTAAGAQVRTIMTENACRLITPVCLQALTHQPVYTSLWAGTEEFKIGHIELADWATVVVVAPATANLIAKHALGIADDALTTILLATRAPLLVAPAMNGNMWLHPATQANVATLKSRGAEFIGPDSGMLACGYEGIGRLWPADGIVARALEIVGGPVA